MRNVVQTQFELYKRKRTFLLDIYFFWFACNHFMLKAGGDYFKISALFRISIERLKQLISSDHSYINPIVYFILKNLYVKGKTNKLN